MSFDPKNVPLRNSASRKAMDQFAVPNRPSAAIQRELRLEREAVDAKTAKLRALRLARDEKTREAAANGPPPKPKKPRKTIITG
jgi:hypothetical protein